MSEKVRKPAISFVELVVLIAVLAMLAGLLLPSLQHHTADARRPGCLNNLKQIGLAMRLYSGDNLECFPCDPGATTLGSFALLTNNYQTSYKTWVCPEDSPVKPGSSTSPWTAKNLSYAYGGFGLKETSQPDTPLACDRSSTGQFNGTSPYAGNRWTHKSDGGNVLFADGHVSFQQAFVPPMYRGKNP